MDRRRDASSRDLRKLRAYADDQVLQFVASPEYPAAQAADGPWVELGEGALAPANLWEARSARRRLGAASAVSILSSLKK